MSLSYVKLCADSKFVNLINSTHENCLHIAHYWVKHWNFWSKIRFSSQSLMVNFEEALSYVKVVLSSKTLVFKPFRQQELGGGNNFFCQKCDFYNKRWYWLLTSLFLYKMVCIYLFVLLWFFSWMPQVIARLPAAYDRHFCDHLQSTEDICRISCVHHTDVVRLVAIMVYQS